jgi:hypothetical protein
VVKFIVFPAHTGELLEALGVVGKEFTTTATEDVTGVQLPTVAVTE